MGIVAAALVAVAAPAALGCGSGALLPPDAGARTIEDGGPSVDGAGLASVDAGGLLDAVPTADPGEGAGPDDMLNSRVCFDGSDQDGDLEVDCADDGCATAPACCVGSTDPRCCQSGAPLEVPIAGCSAGVVSSCPALAGRVVSGVPLISDDSSLVLVSAASVDAAVDFPELSATPRGERVTISALIAAPATTGQLDATAFGLWIPQLPSASVAPIAAVVVSATRGDVSLLVGARIVDSLPLPSGPTRYTLVVEPSGLVTATFAGGARALTATIELPAGRANPVLFGRVQNDRDAGGTTRVRELSVERAACDLPGSLVPSGTPVLASGGDFDPLQATDPSVLAESVSPARVAFVSTQGLENSPHAIFFGTRAADGSVPVAEVVVTVASVASATGMTVTDVGGPELHADGTMISMYFAFETDDDRWHLARLTDVEAARTISVLPVSEGSFDDPALMPDGRLVAREHLAGGGSRIVLLELGTAATTRAGALCASETDCAATRPDDYVHATSPDPLAFDHDEVRAPAVLVHDGVTRIYFAGRRGTRWSVGMLVMGPDGSYFRAANGGLPVLTGGGSTLDTLGAAGPAPFVEGEQLTLFYAGTDGAHWRLASASQPLRGL